MPIDVQLFQHCLLKKNTSSIELLLHLCQELVDIFESVYFRVLSSAQWLTCPSDTSTTSLGYYRYNNVLKLDRLILCTLFFQIILVVLVSLLFHIIFRMILSISIKALVGILIGIVLNLHVCLGRIDIFTVESSNLWTHYFFSHLFRLPLISFINIM